MNVYQRIQTSFDMTLAIKAHLTQIPIELDEPLTATDMRMRENDVTLGIPKTSYKRLCNAEYSKNPHSYFFKGALYGKILVVQLFKGYMKPQKL